MTVIETETARTGEYPQIVRVRRHTLNSDVGPVSGGTERPADTSLNVLVFAASLRAGSLNQELTRVGFKAES